MMRPLPAFGSEVHSSWDERATLSVVCVSGPAARPLVCVVAQGFPVYVRSYRCSSRFRGFY